MSLNGITKGTEFEDMMKRLMQAEANGVMMYYARWHSSHASRVLKM